MKRFSASVICLLLLYFALQAQSAWSATVIYRSVGPLNTAPLAVGAPLTNTLSFSGTTAVFSGGLPPNVGVGDVVQYDSDNNGIVDSLVFICGRISSTTFIVQTASGGTPPGISAVPTWQVYRAYTSLANAESGIENTGINATLSNFDTFTGGKDLVLSNEVWNIACYGDAADTVTANFSGWTTGASNYIRVFAPYQPSEVGVSQRHNGVWSAGAYRLVYNDQILMVTVNHIRFEGIQIWNAAVTANNIYDFYVNAAGPAEIFFSHCLIRGDLTTSRRSHVGIGMLSSGTGNVYLDNNIVCDFNGANNNYCVYVNCNFYVYIYNNTLINGYYGIGSVLSLVTVKNTIFQNCNTGFSGTYLMASDYNASDLAGVPGANSRFGTVAFVNAAGGDYHLAGTDTVARDWGTDLSGDLYLRVTDDIDNQPRSGLWDIGADEYVVPPTITVTSTCSPTPTSTSTPLNTPTQTPSATFSASPTANWSASPSPSATPSGTTIATASATGTSTATATPTSSVTLTATPSASCTATLAGTPSATATGTPTSALTSTAIATPTASPSATGTSTGTLTTTLTATPASSATGGVTASATPSMTSTPTGYTSPTRTLTLTAVSTWTRTPTVTHTATVTPTATITPTLPPTATPTPGQALFLDRNEFRPEAETLGIKAGAEQAAEASILVLTLSGRCVWKAPLSLPGPGYVWTVWNGRNQEGQQVAAGIYYVILRVNGGRPLRRKVLVVR